MKKLGLITILSLATSLFFASNSVKADSCTLINVIWGTTSAASVGQQVPLNITGSAACVGLNGNLEIKEKDTLSDDSIRTIPLIFPTSSANPNSVVAHTVIQFTQEDYAAGGNESTNEEMFVVATLGQSSVNNRNNPLILNQPNGNSQCQLAGAKWYTLFSAQPIVGSPLHMQVTGKGCGGYQVAYQILDSALSDVQVGSMTGQFNAAGDTADVVWKAQGVDQSGADRKIGTYQFYFKAAANNQTVTSSKFPITVNSQNGCINCNNIGGNLPGTFICADGFQGTGTSNICQAHIGDALTDKAGTCTTCVGTSPSPSTSPSGTSSKSYTFQITNPLNGGPSNFFDLINTVTRLLLQISIPIAVLSILYAGFLMLTAGAKPDNFTKGKKILQYTIMGLAIIFIGRGFITLIQSVLELGSSPTTTQSSPNPFGQ